LIDLPDFPTLKPGQPPRDVLSQNEIAAANASGCAISPNELRAAGRTATSSLLNVIDERKTMFRGLGEAGSFPVNARGVA